MNLYTALSGPRGPVSAWHATWLTVLPLGLWLLLTKGLKVAYTSATWLGTGPKQTLVGHAAWLGGFAWSRIGLAVVGAWLLHRLFLRRAPALIGVLLVPILLLGMAVIRSASLPDRGVFAVLMNWVSGFAFEMNIFASAIWRELLTLSVITLVMGVGLSRLPMPQRKVFLRLAQIVVMITCIVISVDLVYLLATGQLLSVAVVLFTSSSLGDLVPLIQAEANVFRVVWLVLGVALPAIWAWRHRSLAERIDPTAMPSRMPVFIALTGTVLLALPPVPANSLPYERYSEGSLIALLKTGLVSPSYGANKAVLLEFERVGRPRWHSANLKLIRSSESPAKNVVIVMMESARAVSSTMHAPDLDTMPYLNQLSRKGLWIHDMSAVVPRTAGAWMAILGGQYPLTNEGTAKWSRDNAKTPRVRGLAAGLREHGYATAFFTPTHLGLLNEVEVVKALGFETIVSAPDLATPGRKPVNYMGLADEVMVDPILAWTTAKKREGKPFMLALMTNVGHHAYETPTNWTKHSFKVPAVSDFQSQLNHVAYLNCMRYVDGVIESLMKGFEQADLIKDTVFVLVGDHGQFFGEHGLSQVFNALYQEGVQVPAILYAPGLAALRGQVHGPRQQIDILPTVVELLGFQVENAQLPGISLLQPVSPERMLFYSSSMENSFLALRQGSMKYIYDFDRGPIQAFDLSVDPAESTQIEVPSERALELKAAMLEWQAAARLSMMARPRSANAADAAWVRD